MSPAAERELRERLGELARRGLSLRDMGRTLEAEGRLSPTGASAWHHHTVARLLAKWDLERGERDVKEVRLELPREATEWLKSRGGRTWLRKAVLKAYSQQAKELHLPSPRPVRPRVEPSPARHQAKLLKLVQEARQAANQIDEIQVGLRHRIEDDDPHHYAVKQLFELESRLGRLFMVLRNLQDALQPATRK